jgi:acyl carrier protein
MTSSQSQLALTDDDRNRIKDIVCEILDVEADEVSDTGLFTEEHGADSMSAVAIMSALESTFDVEIDESKLARMVNLDGVIAVVDEAMAAK